MADVNDFEVPRQPPESARMAAIAVYALYAAGFFVFITFIVGIVVAYVKREEAVGTWLESHYRWQIRTFWYGLLWLVIGSVTFLLVIGCFILLADAVWVIYRVVKGWLRLIDRRPV